MSKYKNPIPHVDDEYESKHYFAGFTFEEPVTKEEAMQGINNVIAENGGKLPDNFVSMGRSRSMRFTLPQNK
jgi:hypothetical protein